MNAERVPKIINLRAQCACAAHLERSLWEIPKDGGRLMDCIYLLQQVFIFLLRKMCAK